MFLFVTTDQDGNQTTKPSWVEGPPDETITWEIAEAGGWNLPAIKAELLRLKRRGKKAEISYGFFVQLIRIGVGNRHWLEAVGAADPAVEHKSGEDHLVRHEETSNKSKSRVEALARALRDEKVPAAFLPIAESLDTIAAKIPSAIVDLEALEQQLTHLDEQQMGIARSRQSERELFDAEQAAESQLRQFCGRMAVWQIAQLKSQFLDRALRDGARLPRISLFVAG